MGSVCVIGEEFGKIKQVLCDGKNVKRAVAGDTVQITGINRNVNSGEWLMEVAPQYYDLSLFPDCTAKNDLIAIEKRKQLMKRRKH